MKTLDHHIENYLSPQDKTIAPGLLLLTIAIMAIIMMTGYFLLNRPEDRISPQLSDSDVRFSMDLISTPKPYQHSKIRNAIEQASRFAP